MATLIPTTGEPFEVAPKNGTQFTLEELQTHVHGYIEALRAPDGRLCFVNEDGKQMALPVNRAATAVMRSALRPDDYIVGPVLLCTALEAGEGDEDEDDDGDAARSE